MYKSQRWSFVAFALFMGYIGVLIPPTGDLYRYQMDYYMYDGLSFSQFLIHASLNFDYLLSFISYFIGKIGLNFDITRFLYNSVTYLLLGNIYLDILNNNDYLKYNKRYRIFALIIFFALNLTSYCLRFGFSCVLFSYGIYKAIRGDSKKGYIFMVLSVINHFSFLLLFIAFLFRSLRFLRFERSVVIFLCLLAFLVNSDVVISLFQKLPFNAIVEHYSYYLDGYWASDYVEDITFRAKVLMALTNSINYILILVYLLKYDKNSNWSPFINIVIILILIVSPFGTIKARYLFFVSHIIKIYLLISFTRIKSYANVLNIVVLSVIFTFFMNLWAVRRQLDVSDMHQLFSSTSYGILTHTYDYSWVYSNVNSDGGLNTDY